LSKATQDIYISVGSFIVFLGIAFLAYHYTFKIPILSSTIGLILSIVLTIGGIVVMYIGDRSGRPSKIATRS
jgi:hypothetical protein